MDGIETREGAAAFSQTTASGYAAVYGSWTVIAGRFRERLAPGVFTRSLREHPDVLALWGHDVNRPLGRTSSGTLRLLDEPRGLKFELDLDPRNPDGQVAIANVDRSDVAGCSFSMRVREEIWEDDGDGLPMRTITEADIFEITLTPAPAYQATTVSLVESQRSTNAANASRRRAEAAMRLRGL